MLLSAFLDDFLSGKKHDLKSPRSREFYRDNFKKFEVWCVSHGITTLDQLDAHTVRHYLDYLVDDAKTKHGHPPSQASLHSYMRAVRAPLNWGVSEGYLSSQVTSRLKMPKVDKKVVEVFTPQQLVKLYAACQDQASPIYRARDMAMLALLLDTGIRASELCTLTLDRTHLDHTDPYIRVIGKGRKERDVGPLGQATCRRLRVYIHRFRKSTTPWTFLSHRGGQLTRLGLDKILYRLRERTGITGVRVSAHTFRHTYACQFLSKGGDIFKLQQLLGHSDIATTQIYLRAFDQSLARRGLDSIADMLLDD